MQIFGMLIFLAIWLLILWIGSIAFEATGLERSKARFQALSALSGTGFTTSQAEAIVEHPQRRRIATYLIFIGNTGIIVLLLLVILYARAGINTPSTSTIAITIMVLLAIGLSVWLGFIDKLTSGVLMLSGRANLRATGASKYLYQGISHAIVKVTIDSKSELIGITVQDTPLFKSGLHVFAIERNSMAIVQPEATEQLSANDIILCYGNINALAETRR